MKQAEQTHEVLSVRFERAMLARVRKVARSTEHSAGQLIRLAVRAWLEGQGR